MASNRPGDRGLPEQDDIIKDMNPALGGEPRNAEQRHEKEQIEIVLVSVDWA